MILSPFKKNNIARCFTGTGLMEQGWIVGFFLISFILHAIYAIKCLGYYHPDEHYRILEFATVKLPFSSASVQDLPWEFQARMRPSLQPYLVVALAKILYHFNIYTPFNTVVIFQLSAALAGWWVNFCLYIRVSRRLTDINTRLVLAYLLSLFNLLFTFLLFVYDQSL